MIPTVGEGTRLAKLDLPPVPFCDCDTICRLCSLVHIYNTHKSTVAYCSVMSPSNFTNLSQNVARGR